MTGKIHRLRADIARNERQIRAREKIISAQLETLFHLHLRIAELEDRQLGIDRKMPIIPMRRI